MMERLLREKSPEHLNSSHLVCPRQTRAGRGKVLLEERGTNGSLQPSAPARDTPKYQGKDAT